MREPEALVWYQQSGINSEQHNQNHEAFPITRGLASYIYVYRFGRKLVTSVFTVLTWLLVEYFIWDSETSVPLSS